MGYSLVLHENSEFYPDNEKNTARQAKFLLIEHILTKKNAKNLTNLKQTKYFPSAS